MKIELEKTDDYLWHVHVDGKYVGRFVPKDWSIIEDNAISRELTINGRLYLESPKEAKAVVRLIENETPSHSHTKQISEIEAYKREQLKRMSPTGEP
jgi:hypothetical protein